MVDIKHGLARKQSQIQGQSRKQGQSLVTQTLRSKKGQSVAEYALVLGIGSVLIAAACVFVAFIDSGTLADHAYSSDIHVVNETNAGYAGLVFLY